MYGLQQEGAENMPFCECNIWMGPKQIFEVKLNNQIILIFINMMSQVWQKNSDPFSQYVSIRDEQNFNIRN